MCLAGNLDDAAHLASDRVVAVVTNTTSRAPAASGPLWACNSLAIVRVAPVAPRASTTASASAVAGRVGVPASCSCSMTMSAPMSVHPRVR